MATFDTDNVLTNNLSVQSTIAIAGDNGGTNNVITSNGGSAIWRRMTGLISQYTEDTVNTQDLNAGGQVKVLFFTEDFDFANIKFVGDAFEFNDSGLYQFTFQCFITGTSSQTAISFFINDNYQYGTITGTTTGGEGINTPLIMQHTMNVSTGDILTIIGERINGGPAYLTRNPLYSAPITKLTIERLI